MNKIRFSILLAFILCLLFSIPTLAQSEGLKLTMSRDWGYGGFNNEIQGLFSMHVSGPEDLIKVEFYIDDLKIGEDNEAPFAFQFTTDTYPLGVHSLYASGTTSGNQTLHSNVIQAKFVSPSEGTDAAIKIAGPILGIVLLAILLSVGVPLIITRGKKEILPLGEERNYGIRGGGICPKCHRPFVLHLWGMNLGLSKFDRCPYCGKWSVVRAQSIEKLREAEKVELEWAKAEIPQIPEDEKLRKEMDDSKYQGS
jgi:Bacterial Ig domain